MPSSCAASVAEPVFINGRFLTQPISGVQRYAHEIVRALDRRPGAADRYVLLTPIGADDLKLTNIPIRTLPGGRGHVWEQTTLAFAARRGRLLSLCGAGPVLHPRQVVVIHDAAVFRHPEHFRRTYAALHRLLGRTLAKRARLATVSDFSRQELSATLHVPASAIVVAPDSADHLKSITPDPAVIQRLDLTDRPYFVVLGNLTPNKNIPVTLRALSRIPNASMRLVLIGGRPKTIFDTPSLPPDPRLVVAGRCTDAEVATLLGQARGLLFPSLYEGFGIPPLEALAHGCPVIASDISPTREVCADAALYFDPTDDTALADHMRHLLTTTDTDRRDAGFRRADLYAWSRSAEILEDRLFST